MGNRSPRSGRVSILNSARWLVEMNDQSESVIENQVSTILSIQIHRVILDILFMEQKNFIGNKSEAFYQNDMIF